MGIRSRPGTLRNKRTLELAVQAGGEERDRPAVGIMCRVHHVLVVEVRMTPSITFMASLEPGVETSGERVHRTAVGVIGGGGGELGGEAGAPVVRERGAVVGLEEFLPP